MIMTITNNQSEVGLKLNTGLIKISQLLDITFHHKSRNN